MSKLRCFRRYKYNNTTMTNVNEMNKAGNAGASSGTSAQKGTDKQSSDTRTARSEMDNKKPAQK